MKLINEDMDDFIRQFFSIHPDAPIDNTPYPIDLRSIAIFAELICKAGIKQGMKQEHALWELAKIGQEIESKPKRNWTFPEPIIDLPALSYKPDLSKDEAEFADAMTALCKAGLAKEGLILKKARQKPLSKESLCEILDVWDYKDETLLELCRRIEAAHEIKE